MERCIVYRHLFRIDDNVDRRRRYLLSRPKLRYQFRRHSRKGKAERKRKKNGRRKGMTLVSAFATPLVRIKDYPAPKNQLQGHDYHMTSKVLHSGQNPQKMDEPLNPGSHAMPIVNGAPISPSTGNWVVQKFGGTSVGKFAFNIIDQVVM